MKRLWLFVPVFLLAVTVPTSAGAATVTVSSNPLWTDTGITLGSGSRIVIHNAHGAWNWGAAPANFGPGGDYRPDLAYDEWITNGFHGQLIGFVGNDPYSASQNDPHLFSIGTATVTVSGVSGRLWLGFNDDFETNAIDDNTGSVTVDLSQAPNSAHLAIVGGGDQVTLSAGQCVALSLQVRFVGAPAYTDVTSDPNTSFFTNPHHGSISGSELCVGAADAGTTFPVYGRYRDPVTGVFVTDTVIVHVHR